MKVILALHFSSTLFLLVLFGEPAKQGADAFPVTCCMRVYDIKVRREHLRNYTIQDKPLCPIKAVRFITNKNFTFCLDPSKPWAINTMAYLNNRN